MKREVQMTRPDIITLRVPVLLAFGCPVVKTWNRAVLPDDDPADEFSAVGVALERLPDDEAGERWRCWFDDARIGLDVGFTPDVPIWWNNAPYWPGIDYANRAASTKAGFSRFGSYTKQSRAEVLAFGRAVVYFLGGSVLDYGEATDEAHVP